MTESTVIQYHRRNDRTPEKDFDKRDETNKIMSCEVRKAVERARSRITDLEDEVTERDAVIETERSLRIAAENRLQEHLVDPYTSPNVNQELRERLPRAKKDDPKLKEQNDHIEEIFESMETQHVSVTNRPPSPDQLGQNKSPNQVRKVLDFKGSPRNKSDASDVVKPLFHKTQFSNNFGGLPQYMPPMYIKPGLNSTFNPSGAYSYNLTSPRHPVRTQNGASQDDLSEKMDTSFSMSELQSEELPPRDHVQRPFLHSQMISGYPSPIKTSFSSHQPSFYQPTSLTELPSYSNHLTPSDQTRQVALLLSELDAAKSQNKKLMEKLINMELDLESEKIKAKVREADEKGHTDASVAAGLVQQVHKAQKRKEEAMMGRIKVANQERDESMFRLSEMERRYEESFSQDNRSDNEDIDEEMDINENFDQLLTRVGHYDFPSIHEYTALVRKLEQAKQRQRDVTTDELQAILEQRDLALDKARKLEEELIKYQREDTLKNSDQNLRAELAVVKQERELALTKIRQLKDENEAIRIYYSLHKSLSQESIHQKNNNTFQLSQSKLSNNKENNTSVAELQDVSMDQLQADLEKKDRKLEETQAQLKKSERLVTVLRKKLKGADNSSED